MPQVVDITSAAGTPLDARAPPLLEETLDTMEVLGALPERMSAHHDRGYDSDTTREKLQIRGPLAEIFEKGKPAPLTVTRR